MKRDHYRTISCPDCPERPGLNLNSPNPERPETCPTCAGYGTILHPEEFARTKADYQKMRNQAAYDLKRRLVEKSDRSDLKPWPEYIEGRWSA
jgi:hypothetical protein